MANAAIGFGIALVILGLVSYFGTGTSSLTALIPADLGVLLVVAGAMARIERFHKTAMHIAVALSLIGFLGAAGGIPKFLTYISGGEVERPAAAVSQFVMALLCILFVGLGVKSFADARRKRVEG